MKSYLRYFIEFLVIITGVLLSFYLDDLRQLNEKKNYKDTLVEELLITSEEDLKQITKITADLDKVQEFIDEFLKDIEDGIKDLDDDQIAEKYLFIVQKMSVSFFPQNGTFNQLISTGSLDLINSKSFRRVLLNNYTHYYDRNSANNRTLDDLYLAFGANIDPYITVVAREVDDATFIYSDMVVESYDIDQDFYLSNTFKSLSSYSKIYGGKKYRYARYL